MTFLGPKLGRPRFRVRTLLILVAVVAFAIEGGREGVHWLRFDHRYRVSKDAALNHQRGADDEDARAAQLDEEADSAVGAKAKVLRDLADKARREAEGFRSAAEWSKGLASKYEKARRTPWRDVPGDPPHRANDYMIFAPGW